MVPIAGVRETIKKYNMIERGDRIIVGLSGGADSVCLLTVLVKLKALFGIEKIAAAHINHHMRETAGRDADFSRKLCDKLGIEIYIKDIDIFALAKQNKTSAEDAGRTARYEFFAELREKYGFNKIATAHNMNDQAETFLMRILSGTTLDGLSCIKPVRQDGIIRPLIETKRSEIEEYLKSVGQSYMNDETNSDNSYKRNSIRLDLIPFIEKKYNPSFIETAAQMVEAFSKDSEYIIRSAHSPNLDLPIETERLKQMDDSVLSRVIPEIIGKRMSKKGISEIISLIRKDRSGSSLKIDAGRKLKIEFGKLYITEETSSNEGYCVKLNMGRNYIKEADAVFILSEGRAEGKSAVNISDPENLYLRTRRGGDKIYVKSIGGRKRVKDIFIEKKIPSKDREIWPILTENEEIVWVTGLYKNEKNNSKYNVKAEWRGLNV